MKKERLAKALVCVCARVLVWTCCVQCIVCMPHWEYASTNLSTLYALLCARTRVYKLLVYLYLVYVSLTTNFMVCVRVRVRVHLIQARDRWNRWKSTQNFNRVGAEWEEKYNTWDKWLPSDDEEDELPPAPPPDTPEFKIMEKGKNSQIPAIHLD